MAEELRQLYDKLAAGHTSLVSKLAQHNGLRQFSADFMDRAPPPEWRALLPELEAAIRESLQELEQILVTLHGVEASRSATPAERKLRDSLVMYGELVLGRTRNAFEEQRTHLRTLAKNSSLCSLMLGQQLRELDSKARSPLASALMPVSDKGLFVNSLPHARERTASPSKFAPRFTGQALEVEWQSMPSRPPSPPKDAEPGPRAVVAPDATPKCIQKLSSLVSSTASTVTPSFSQAASPPESQASPRPPFGGALFSTGVGKFGMEAHSLPEEKECGSEYSGHDYILDIQMVVERLSRIFGADGEEDGVL